jgi:hypothetical protein
VSRHPWNRVALARQCWTGSASLDAASRRDLSAVPDLRLLPEPIDDHGRPAFGVVNGMQLVEPQGFARAWLINRKR